ncbi:MAG TPA: YhjD/YihY/BrkB family envelope integrity protein, partial [Kineosporiaceae bacterium]|nr:YhjD/YihY/BrkB family envelope integrity protein [Kineosporiaceae bacterium]
MSARVQSLARRLARETRARMHGHDLWLASAGAAFYGALTVVPSVLVAISLAQVVLGRSRVRGYGAALAGALPQAIGADAAALRLLDAGITLTPIGVIFAIAVASAYGEGLSRALTRFAPVDFDAKSRAVWLRVATLPLLGLAP